MGFFLGTIVSFILNIFYGIFKFLVKVVKDILIATKLIWPVLCAATGGVLMLTGTVVYGEISFVYFALCMSFSVMLTVFLWYRQLRLDARRRAAKRSRYFRGDAARTSRGRFVRTGKRDSRAYRNTMQSRRDVAVMPIDEQRYYKRRAPQYSAYPGGSSLHEQSVSPPFEPQNSENFYRQNTDFPQEHYNSTRSAQYGGYDGNTQFKDRFDAKHSGQAYYGDDARQGTETDKGKLFRVRQNPRFLMREFSDRVELYEDTPQGLKYIRTDYKAAEKK